MDRHVAARIRRRRVALGLTQRRVADLVGVTGQQLRLYETGTNRVSAGRLFTIAQALEVDVGYFYQGLGGTPAAPTLRERRALELARDFAAIGGPRTRAAVCNLARALAGAEPEGDLHPG